jgi:hypothetical protein
LALRRAPEQFNKDDECPKTARTIQIEKAALLFSAGPGSAFRLLFIVLPIAMLSHWFFPLLSRLKRTGDPTIVWIALALGAIGVALLFAARLPLYRQRRFFVFGPRELDEKHRRLYRWAYKFVGTSVCLLVLLLLILR